MIAAGPWRERAVLSPWTAALIVGLLATTIALATVSPYLVGSFQDDGIYVILGRALASGAGYRYLQLPNAPAATHYPPGYPALLAVLWTISPRFPGNIVTFERANAVLLGVSAALGVALGRRAGLPTPWAAAVGLLGAASIPPLALASMVLSESCFLAVLLGALLAAEAVADGAPTVARPGGTSGWAATVSIACGAGALCGLVVLVRSVGAVIIPAAVGICILDRRWRAAAALAVGAVVVVLPWQLWAWTHAGELAPILQGKYGSYSGWLTGAWHRHGIGFALATVTQNAADLTATFAVQLAPGLPVAIKIAALAACGVLLMVGAVALARRAPVTTAFGAMYLAVVLVWPFPPFRFIWAIWLLLVLVLALGARSVIDWHPVGGRGRAGRGVGLVASAGIALCLLRYDALGYRHHWWNTMQGSLSMQTARPLAWLAAHPGLPELTMSEVEPSLYLYAGRRGIPCNAFTPDEYVYARDTGRDRRALDAALRQFPVESVIATGPACALAALRIAAAPAQSLVAVDTAAAGLAVFVRSHP